MKKRLSVLLALLVGLLSVLPASAAGDPQPPAAGDILTFGRYPHAADGAESPIEWTVLDAQDGKVLLISRYGLDAQPYHSDKSPVTWESCALRSWLNNDFLNRAFTAEEQAAIRVTEVSNTSAQGLDEWANNSGPDTQDQVFLLSYAEANRYFSITKDDKENTGARIEPTPYALSRKAYTDETLVTADGAPAGWWWIRSLSSLNFAGYVRSSGSVDTMSINSKYGCVRPALWVSADFFSRGSSAAGTDQPQDGSAAFVFRNAVTWGMSLAEVTAAEGNPVRDLDENDDYCIYYDPVKVSSVSNAILGYSFRKPSDTLISAWYAIKEAPQDTCDYFEKAYTLKYGEPKEADPEAFVTKFNLIHDDQKTTSDFRAGSFRRWEGPGETDIWMAVRNDGNLLLMIYFSPDVSSEPRTEELNLNGI